MWRSRRELSNAYFLAKFRFDAARTSPVKFAVSRDNRTPRGSTARRSSAQVCTSRRLPVFGKISAKCCSFSAVPAPIFARKYKFYSIFQNLPDHQAEIFEIWQNFANLNFAKFAIFFAEFSQKLLSFSKRLFVKILRLQQCKSMQIL